MLCGQRWCYPISQMGSLRLRLSILSEETASERWRLRLKPQLAHPKADSFGHLQPPALLSFQDPSIHMPCWQALTEILSEQRKVPRGSFQLFFSNHSQVG